MMRARPWTILLLAAGLVLALASGLAACGGSADGALPSPENPPPPAAPPAPAVTPVEPPATDPPAPTAASSPPPATILEPSTAPGEPSVPDAPTPTATAASESTAALVESSTGAPSAATDEAEAMRLRYDTYDRSGAVTEPGHYVFLADAADPASVVTTYEGLRDGTATALRIHTHDAHGVSQAAFYNNVETGDLVEWKRAADCFVRYTVTSAPTPAAGAVTRAFGVAWMTYAFTGCSGAISTTGTTTVDVTWGTVLPDLGGASLTAPIRHGSRQLVPQNWTGATQDPEPYHEPPVAIEPSFDHHGPPNYRTTADLAEAQTYPYWRTPTLPAGWRFAGAHTSGECVTYGYCATFKTPEGWSALSIKGAYAVNRGFPTISSWSPTGTT